MMKLRWLLLWATILPTAVGAGAASLGLYWGGLWGFAQGALVALIVPGAVALWLHGRLWAELRSLGHTIDTGESDGGASASLEEFKQLGVKLSAFTQRWAKTLGQARQQSCEVASLLAHLNRRSLQDRGPAEAAAPASQLRHLLASLAKTAEGDLQQVVTCSRDIDRRTQEIGAGIEEQTGAVGETTTFVEQMSANIDSVSHNADAAHKAAVAARESAAAGLDLVRELIRGMDRIRLHVAAGGKKLRTLGDRSHEIGSIVETIGSISARTDMLALNASIESVRAGEHGRGFAVVADEVRKLAEQTAQATREVTSLIQSIQMESQESISAIADEQDQVEAEVRRVTDAGTALERISQTSSDSAQRVGEISGATLHQLRVTQKVVSAMQRISEIARGIRHQINGVSGSTNSLQDLANQLSNSLAPLRGCSSISQASGGASFDREATAWPKSERGRARKSDQQNEPQAFVPNPSGEAQEDALLVGAGTEIDAV
jgi:methyl-accepting chemotaxis protein